MKSLATLLIGTLAACHDGNEVKPDSSCEGCTTELNSCYDDAQGAYEDCGDNSTCQSEAERLFDECDRVHAECISAVEAATQYDCPVE